MSVVTRSGAVALTGRQKAAVFLITIGTTRAADVLKFLSEREIEAISAEMASLWRVKSETADAVVQELAERFDTQNEFAMGGLEFAREVLEHLLGATRAEEILGRLTAQIELRPFEFLRRTPPEQIATFLRNEAPADDRARRRRPAHDARRQGPRLPGARGPGRRRDAHRDDGGDQPGGRRGGRARCCASSSPTSSPQEFSPAGGVNSLAEHPQPRRPLHRAQRARGARRDRRRAGRRDPPAAVHLRGHRQARRPRRSSWCCGRSTRRTSRSRCAASATRSGHGSSATCPSAAPRCSQEEIETSQPQRRAVVEEAQSRIVGVVRRLEEAGAITLGRGGEDGEACEDEHRLMEAFEFPALEPPPGPAPSPRRTPEPCRPVDLRAEAEAARAAGHEAGFQAGRAEAHAHWPRPSPRCRPPPPRSRTSASAWPPPSRPPRSSWRCRSPRRSSARRVAVEPERVVDAVRGALRRLVERERVTCSCTPTTSSSCAPRPTALRRRARRHRALRGAGRAPRGARRRDRAHRRGRRRRPRADQARSAPREVVEAALRGVETSLRAVLEQGGAVLAPEAAIARTAGLRGRAPTCTAATAASCDLIGLIVEATGLEAEVGERLRRSTRAATRDRRRPPLPAEVVGFRDGRTLLMPLGETPGIGPGDVVTATGARGLGRRRRRACSAACSTASAGRSTAGPAPAARRASARSTRAPPDAAAAARASPSRVTLGVRAIDALVPCGRGQRLGIFAGSGVGK